ncbi:hypothetical protein L2E82_38937 [Cichorium intybus]|uniref:Uncharacterized protein n=1 Tax=Cichorium intybus TaxID=13427 RepID=A0ACB9AHK9_CICIN|nr:hypothetical protein L2E82_38937 [Cichorium intybus]
MKLLWFDRKEEPPLVRSEGRTTAGYTLLRRVLLPGATLWQLSFSNQASSSCTKPDMETDGLAVEEPNDLISTHEKAMDIDVS